MFRDDIADLTGVPAKKMMIYTPIATVCSGYCITVYIEGRSGLKFPAPPTFVSGIYLFCLGIGFIFMGLSAWLVFHAGMRASVAAVQFRTRSIRLPLPTQRQLDQARKLSSSYEETSFYDMFRVPYVMPNLADTPDHSEDDNPLEKGASKSKDDSGKGGSPLDKQSKRKALRMPYRPGCPEWIEREKEHYEDHPNAAPSTAGTGPVSEPYEHFEMIRKAQKDWWAAEVYGRVCLLTGQIHLYQGFGYWLVIHCIAEIGYVWCAEVLAAAFSAGIWLIFHLDILPSKGGIWPVEACGPFLAALTLTLQYSHSPTPFIIDISRVTAIGCIILNILFTIRLLLLARPAGVLSSTPAREAGGSAANLSAPCQNPQWLPSAYQVTQYLVAPPRSFKAQEITEDDPMVDVDMQPWYATRALYVACIILWGVLLVGRIVECATGERMWVTNPGFPPWTRIGQWDGWESGPITSKHYAHVTPMRGHFAWKYGQGPMGYQELWPSDLYGFAPEADAHWADENVPYLKAPPGAAIHDYKDPPMKVIPVPPNHADAQEKGHGDGTVPDGGHAGGRRLRNFLKADEIRPLVPAAVRWPAMFEPDFVVCAPLAAGGEVFTFTATGAGAKISGDAAVGKIPGAATDVALHGLPISDFARGVTWSQSGLTVVTGHGALHHCAHHADNQFKCEAISSPPVPVSAVRGAEGPLPAVAVRDTMGQPVFAAVAVEHGEVQLLHREFSWRQVDKVRLPSSDVVDDSQQPSVVSLSASEDHLIVSASDGATYRWELQAGRIASAAYRDSPAATGAYAAAGTPRTWRGACVHHTGRIVRLSSRWQKSGGSGALAWHPELLF
jgi:hypothetical protein